jgi:hypothetical protein
MRNYVFFIILSSLVVCEGKGFDDWALVNKYCPLRAPAYEPPEAPGETFFIYRDNPVYERTLRRAFDWTMGRSLPRAKLEKDSEFFGEVMVFCDLLKHPQRTWDPTNATLFIVPAFPTLVRESPSAVNDALLLEPSWQRSKGRNHLVLCTHWGCASRLGPLFESVALPGLLGALERNARWLDPRLHRVDLDHDWARKGPVPLSLASGDHPLCPERTIVLPYPAHHGIVECRQKHPHSNRSSAVDDRGSPGPSQGSRGATVVFFAGALRSKLCGYDPVTGAEAHSEPSHGVRPALTAENLLARYPQPEGGQPEGGRNAFANESHMYGELYRRGYHLQVRLC